MTVSATHSRNQRFNWPSGAGSDAQVRARSLHGFIDCLESLGGDPDRVLPRCGLNRRDLEDPDRWLSFRSATDAYERAAEEIGDRTFGLELALHNDLSYLGPIAILAYHSKTTGDALEGVSRFISVQNTALGISLEAQGDLSLLRFDLPEHLRADADLWMEDSLLRACLFWGEITGSNLRPVSVLMRHARAHPTSVYQDAFAAAVEFDQEKDGVVLESRDLATPVRTPESETYDAILSELEDRVADIDSTLVAVVNTLLQTLIPMQRGQLDCVAMQLHMHPRTLQRHLRKSGASFADLLEAQKRQMAERLLSTSTLPLVDIAHYIGYADQSAFNHAFGRWHGNTPGSWRAAISSQKTCR